MGDEPWLRGSNFLKLYGPAQFHHVNLMVKDLMTLGKRKWNLQVIPSTLLPAEAQAIVRVPFFDSVKADSKVWWPSNHRSYIVKSAYNLFLDEVLD